MLEAQPGIHANRGSIWEIQDMIKAETKHGIRLDAQSDEKDK
jgi:hypothetical protein